MVVLGKREELISLVESNDNFFREVGNKNAFFWENHLFSDYWKNWREKIRVSQTEKDAEFLAVKVSKLRTDIIWIINYYKGERYDVNHIKKLIEIKEKELRNITRDEWEFVEKISNDLERLFRVGINGYQFWSEEELIKEISELKKEIEKLRTIEINGDYGKSKIKEFSQNLERKLQNSQISLEVLQKNRNNNNNLPILPIIGIVSLFALLLGFIAYKRKRK